MADGTGLTPRLLPPFDRRPSRALHASDAGRPISTTRRLCRFNLRRVFAGGSRGL
ncbi:MAG: hypothetical protein H0W76_28950 [Pyrinomonadaceae bacterium]|nr:hypothetical protein [Pyrinomonadaceae bacterium]